MNKKLLSIIFQLVIVGIIVGDSLKPSCTKPSCTMIFLGMSNSYSFTFTKKLKNQKKICSI